MTKVLTQFSLHANTIADTFRAAFVKTRVGDCTVEMTAPEESTRGGLLGLQHATLRTASGMALVVGTVHAGEKKAELRTFSLVARMYEKRFNTPPPFGEPDYKAFLAKAEPILAAFGLKVSMIDLLAEPPSGVEEAIESIPPARRSGWPIVTWILFLLALAAIVGGGFLWGRRWIKR